MPFDRVSFSREMNPIVEARIEVSQLRARHYCPQGPSDSPIAKNILFPPLQTGKVVLNCRPLLCPLAPC